MALMEPLKGGLINPEITRLQADWRHRAFGEFDFVVTDLAKAPEAMRCEALLLLREKLAERGRYDDDR